MSESNLQLTKHISKKQMVNPVPFFSSILCDLFLGFVVKMSNGVFKMN